MQIICSNNSIKALLEENHFDRTNKYKVSIFTVSLLLGNDVLLYNTLTKTLVAIQHEVWDYIQNGNFDKIGNYSELEELISEHFVVPTVLDETNLYLELYTLVRQLADTDKGIDRYNILTTTACNARCFYCFEKGIRPIHMTKEIAVGVAKFIESTCTKQKPIHLRWFGGEPLVNRNVINIICESMKKSNIDFYSTMSSNGLLLSGTVIKTAKELWNMKSVRVSLDGFAEEHNKRKNYYTTGDHFSKTIQNLHSLVENNIKANIRLTIDHNNINCMLDLSKWLVKEFGKTPMVSIYTRCIFNEVSTEKAQYNKKQVDMLVNKEREIDEWLNEHGVYDSSRISPIGFNNYFCAANNPHAVVISPEGYLCSCESVNDSTQYWGDIWNGETNSEVHNMWLYGQIRGKCVNCSFLPVCTPFDHCGIDYYNCREKNEYLHKWYMKEQFSSIVHC